MKKTLSCTLWVLGGVFFLFAPAEGATVVKDNIITPTTWSSEEGPYFLSGNISVTSELTIEPGTIIKLGGANSLFVQSGGSLTATGALFTTSVDDAHGGPFDADHPSDSDSKENTNNWWGGIHSSGELVLKENQFLYGGRASKAMVEVSGGRAVVQENTFQYANNAVIVAGGVVTVTENSFEDIGQYAVWQKQGNITFGSNKFTNITRDSYLLTKDTFTNKGENEGDLSINIQNVIFSRDTTLKADNLPYIFNALKISAGSTLTLEAGSIVKFWNATNALVNDGTFKVLGTRDQPVILTSYHDDEVSGDSNKNGSATKPQAGQWGRIYNNASGTIEFTYTTLRYGGNSGISETGLIINYGALSIDHSSLADSKTVLVNAKKGVIDITKSELARANELLVSHGQAQVSIHTSDLLESVGNRITNASSGLPVDASNNYWGNETGPRVWGNVAVEPAVSTNVIFEPYQSTSSLCHTDCFSNVLFLPGIMGSHLYETQEGDEKALWFSSLDDRQERMEMKSDGTSKYPVYTKEGKTGIVANAYGNLYQSFLEDLESWKTEGLFTAYAAIPYDWRLSLEDIVMNGKVDNGKLTYLDKNNDVTQSYLYQQARILQQTSKSENITLIGHSNGGLVIKAFIQKLKETNDPLYYQIDKIIFVGVPQTGTPDSVVSLLYGSKIGILWIGTSAKRARFLAQGMPTMYNLLPSEELFSQLPAPIEFRGDNIPTEWESRYGEKINTYDEFEDFLTGGDKRGRPAYNDLLSPEVLSEGLFTQARNVHSVLDSWSPAPTTQVIQIAGWGIYTVESLEIVDDKECKFDAKQLVDKRPVCYEKRPTTTIRDKVTLDGDTTVLVKSAHSMPLGNKVRKYWVDLARYNKESIEFFKKKHNSLLEVSALREFISSTVFEKDRSTSYVFESEPSSSASSVSKYTIHSPLHLTLIDEDGNKTGWDEASGQIIENIKGAQYSEIGEIKTVLIPKSTAHTVKLQAYEQGSFTLDILELNGEKEVRETKFQAIPTLENTLVTLEPGNTLVMKLDFDADGSVESTLTSVDGQTVEYPTGIPSITSTTSDQQEEDKKESDSKEINTISSGVETSLVSAESYQSDSENEEISIEVPSTEVKGSDSEPHNNSSPFEPETILPTAVALKRIRIEKLLITLGRILKLKK